MIKTRHFEELPSEWDAITLQDLGQDELLLFDLPLGVRLGSPSIHYHSFNNLSRRRQGSNVPEQ